MRHRIELAVLPLALAGVVTLLTASVLSSPQERSMTRLASGSAGALREWDGRLVRMEREGRLRLRKAADDTLLAARRIERLDQYYRGVPVVGGDVVRQTERDLPVFLTGTIYDGIDLDVTPRLAPADAAAVFLKATGASGDIDVRASLAILPTAGGGFVLTYKLTGFTGTSLPVLFVNARTGAVEAQYDNLRQAAAIGRGRGVLGDEKKVSAASQGGVYLARDEMRPSTIRTFDLRGDLARSEAVEDRGVTLGLPDLATDTDNDWTDGAVVDAHVYLGWTYDYFFKRFGLRGLDGRDGRQIIALMHSVRREDMNTYNWAKVADYYVNAWFCGRCGVGGDDTMMFGEGLPAGYYMKSSGQYYDNAAASLDIVAHEYAHGVDSYASDLIYQNESGALSEAFSDVMATGVEFFFQPEGNGSLKADYLHGEDSRRASQPGSKNGNRSLEDPTGYGLPDHYSKRVTGPEDNGGVHTNSTIASHAFYLAIVGGTNRTSGRSVQGVGGGNRDQIEKVFYRGMTTLPSGATFSMARASTIESARALYGAGSAAERATTQAWDAVGVF